MSAEWLREQGRYGLNRLPPPSVDHVYQDTKVDREVFILVYAPTEMGYGHRDLHWSLAWNVSGGALRHIHVITEPDGEDNHGIPTHRLVYWGPITKTPPRPGSATTLAQRVPLGTMDYEKRQAIERISWETPVHVPDGQWNCQSWIADLLNRLAQAKIISSGTWAEVVAAVTHGMFHTICLTL